MIALLAGVVAMMVGTFLGAPVVTPVVVGAALGLLAPARASRTAALAAAVAWGGVLLAATLRGDSIGTLASALGGAMGIPGWALVLATLLYPALLAASAAWLAHLASPRRQGLIRSFDVSVKIK
jgi:hypothetical protein